MKKLVYLVTEDWYFCSHRLALALAARQAGFEIHVITNAGESADQILSIGLILHPLTMHRAIGSPLRELATLIKLILLYRRIRPDLIHHVSLKPVIYGSVAAWLTGVPRVVNAYTGLGYLFISDSRLARIFTSVIAPLMSVIMKNSRSHSVVQNSDDEKVLLKLGLIQASRTTLIRGSGVDTKQFYYEPEVTTDRPVVLFASRLLKDKGILEFIEAARTLKDTMTTARFVVVGTSDEANPASIDPAILNESVANGIVEWWGQRDDMCDVFKQSHIVCLPSYREGLPKVLLEAAACGRPIVTTDVPGCREVVVDGINGFLVPVRESAGLADAIQRLLASPELRRQMGEAGRKRVVQNFDVDKVNAVTIEVYNRLLFEAE